MMRKGTKWAMGIGISVITIGGTVWVIRRRAARSIQPTALRPALNATELAWPAPVALSNITTANMPGISVGTGNQPNGQYELVRAITAPMDGTYTVQMACDDAGILIIDSAAVRTVADSQGLVTFTVPLTAGAHVLTVLMTNNDMAVATAVPYTTANANPTGLVLSLTCPSGCKTIVAGDVTGWHCSGYLSALQVSSTRPLNAVNPIMF